MIKLGSKVEFAPVVPVDIAAEMKRMGCLGNYHLLLAHDVVKQPKEYQNVYCQPDDVENFIIMDNSVVELGQAVDIEMILEAAQIVNAELLVLPDVYLKGPETVIATVEAYEKLQGRWHNDYMVLPQGRDYPEWLACADEFCAFAPHQFACIGIPRNVREHLGVSRIEALSHVRQFDHKYHGVRANKRYYHLFGFSHDLMDDIASASYGRGKNLMGIDSNVPIRQGTLGQRININQTDPGKRGDWWDNHPPFNGIAYDNLDQVRRWIK